MPKLGLEGFTFHNTRHTVIALLRNAEVQEARIKDIVGHEHEDVTNLVYGGKVKKEVLLRALATIDYGYEPQKHDATEVDPLTLPD